MATANTYDTQTDPLKATQPSYTKVATAPDGVPVYQSGGNYYTQNADQSYTQQFQGGTPDWLKPQAGAAGGTQPAAGGAQTSYPSYYNAQDPTHQAVWNSFQAKGIQPRDQADFQYWVDKINQSGGLANGYQNSGGTGTWQDRMNAAQGGVGDYSTGGSPIKGGTMPGAGGGFTGTGTMFNGANGTFGSPEAASLYENLLGRANQSLKFDPNADPIARAQIDSFDAARQRNDKNTLSSVAEQAGPNTNLSAIQRSAGEASGQATAGFTGQLAQQEVAARRQEIQSALQMGAGLLTSQQQMALQEELANLDRAQQESQFGRSLANNAYQFDINDQYRNSPLSWA